MFGYWFMSEKAVPEPWEAVVMPTDCVGVLSTSLGIEEPEPVWSEMDCWFATMVDQDR